MDAANLTERTEAERRFIELARKVNAANVAWISSRQKVSDCVASNADIMPTVNALIEAHDAAADLIGALYALLDAIVPASAAEDRVEETHV